MGPLAARGWRLLEKRAEPMYYWKQQCNEEADESHNHEWMKRHKIVFCPFALLATEPE